MAASGAKYGIATSHFYWVGAIPAMVFVGVFMMPFYYGSRARSVPEYLKLRFDEKTRGFNAISFAAMTVFSSGISMYAMGLLLDVLLGWDFNFSILVSAVIVLAYIFLGGLTSAIYNEVLQFFLIVLGFVAAGLPRAEGRGRLGRAHRAAGGDGAAAQGFAPGAWTQSLAAHGQPGDQPDGRRVVRAWRWGSASCSRSATGAPTSWSCSARWRPTRCRPRGARRSSPPFPKMFFPFLVILPGMIAIALTTQAGASGFALPLKADGTLNYDLAIPMMLAHYFPPGLLGLGLTALMASFMSGMAGNVTAFNTVWTYDIYQTYIRKGASDRALPVDGAHGHGRRHRALRRRRRTSRRSSTTSWTCCSWCSRS